jgi:hypothetical protein
MLGSEFEVESHKTIERLYAMRAVTEQSAKTSPATQRRGPGRAPKLARLPAKPAMARPAAPKAKVAAGGGGEGQWEEF